MLRALVGLLKGLVVGIGASVGLLALVREGFDVQQGLWPYLLCVGAGAIIGVICGRPPWKVETFWVSVLKCLFGVIVCTVGYAAGHHLLPSLSLFSVSFLSNQPFVLNTAVVLSPAIGALCGLIIEWDDGGVSASAAVSKAPSQGDASSASSES